MPMAEIKGEDQKWNKLFLLIMGVCKLVPLIIEAAKAIRGLF
jgi:hypothetical protein